MCISARASFTIKIYSGIVDILILLYTLSVLVLKSFLHSTSKVVNSSCVVHLACMMDEEEKE